MGFQKILVILIGWMLLCGTCFSQVSVTARIHLNQVGFYTDAPKKAVLTGNATTPVFYVTTTNLRDTVYTGQLGVAKQSSNSNTITRIADFSGLKKAGSYCIVIPGVGHSYPFPIGESIHAQAAKASLKGFYFQRASMPL